MRALSVAAALAVAVFSLPVMTAEAGGVSNDNKDEDNFVRAENG